LFSLVTRAAGLCTLIMTVSVLSIIPLIAAFLLTQRYWQSGLTLGSQGIAELEERGAKK
jgi:ABC-type glycerol-3-phosphate transport system permease component